MISAFASKRYIGAYYEEVEAARVYDKYAIMNQGESIYTRYRGVN